MERLLVVWCPSLLGEGDQGKEVREFLAVVQAVGAFCPWTEAASLGVCTLPARGPSRFFGGEAVLVERLVATALEVLCEPGSATASAPTSDLVRVGIADGLFAAMLAARSETIVPTGGSAEFLAPWSVSVLRRSELAVTLQCLGVHTLGQFAALPSRHVLARFGADGAACHRVARGEEGELIGLRDPSIHRRLKVVRGEDDEGERHLQRGFFGGASAAGARAAQALARLQERLGPEAVLVGHLCGGRSPAERGRLVPWGSKEAGRPSADAPWPGHLPQPSPVTVLAEPLSVEVVDASARPLRVTGRGLLVGDPGGSGQPAREAAPSGEAGPARLSVTGGPWQDVAAWAGPWPAAERWWIARRQRARLQVVTGDGAALLLVAERGRWWLEAVYD